MTYSRSPFRKKRKFEGQERSSNRLRTLVFKRSQRIIRNLASSLFSWQIWRRLIIRWQNCWRRYRSSRINWNQLCQLRWILKRLAEARQWPLLRPKKCLANCDVRRRDRIDSWRKRTAPSYKMAHYCASQSKFRHLWVVPRTKNHIRTLETSTATALYQMVSRCRRSGVASFELSQLRTIQTWNLTSPLRTTI